jgi:hypothetical protein
MAVLACFGIMLSDLMARRVVMVIAAQVIIREVFTVAPISAQILSKRLSLGVVLGGELLVEAQVDRFMGHHFLGEVKK